MKNTSLFAAIILSSLLASTSYAAQIAFDSFTTTAGAGGYSVGDIAGQNPTVGLSGFTGAWQAGTGAIDTVDGGLTHSMTPGATLAGHVVPNSQAAGSNPGRRLSRAINYTPTDGTYYMSSLFQKNVATTTFDILAGLSPLDGATTSITGGNATQVGILNGGISFGSNGTFTELLSASDTAVNETYFALLEIDYSTTGTDSVTATIFDESSTQVAMQTFSGLNLDGNIGRLSYATAQFGDVNSNNVIADEFRFGTTLADVANVAVPEPASIAVWTVLGLAALALRFSKRSRKGICK